MLLAKSPDAGGLVRAERGERAYCPGCDEPVLAKCGEVLIWHWAHRSGRSCDGWSEPETQWHANWKTTLGEAVEVRCERGTLGEDGATVVERHRADAAVVVNGLHRWIEVQHSSLSLEDVRTREAFYDDLAWVFDCREIPSLRIEWKEKDRVFWHWFHPVRRWMLSVTRRAFWDLGDFAIEPMGGQVNRRGTGAYGYARAYWSEKEVEQRIREAPGWAVGWRNGLGRYAGPLVQW